MPPGMGPGSEAAFTAPDGRVLRATIPAGATEDSLFDVRLPPRRSISEEASLAAPPSSPVEEASPRRGDVIRCFEEARRRRAALVTCYAESTPTFVRLSDRAYTNLVRERFRVSLLETSDERERERNIDAL